jgi:hypothetical protein
MENFKKLKKLTLHNATLMTAPQMKNIKGGGYFSWCTCGYTKWDCSSGRGDCYNDCIKSCGKCTCGY